MHRRQVPLDAARWAAAVPRAASRSGSAAPPPAAPDRRPPRPAPVPAASGPGSAGSVVPRRRASVTSTVPGTSSMTSRRALDRSPAQRRRAVRTVVVGMHLARRGRHAPPPIPLGAAFRGVEARGQVARTAGLSPGIVVGRATVASPSRADRGRRAAHRPGPATGRSPPAAWPTPPRSRAISCSRSAICSRCPSSSAISSSRLARYRSSGASIPAAYRISSFLNRYARRNLWTSFEIALRTDTNKTTITLESVSNADEATLAFHMQLRRLKREGSSGELIPLNCDGHN